MVSLTYNIHDPWGLDRVTAWKVLHTIYNVKFIIQGLWTIEFMFKTLYIIGVGVYTYGSVGESPNGSQCKLAVVKRSVPL